MADPPWRFEVYSRDTGLQKSADNHYPTMTVEEIATLKIPAAKGAVLFLWATAPMLENALDVMRAWGFKYKSNLVWVKSKIATGYWFRNQHEILLIGTSGDFPSHHSKTVSSLVIDPTREHSRKPDRVYEIIERYYPSETKIELFARTKRFGWTAWGNEV